jgi:hypothetical protein
VNLKDQASKFTTENPLMSALMDAGKVVMGAPPKNAEIPRGTAGTSSATTPGSNPPSNSEVTHTLNVNVNSNNPNIDTKQVLDWFNNSDVKQKVITTVSEVYGNAIGRPIPSKNEPR